MAYEPRPGDATAWPKKDSDHEKAPDFKGSIIAHRDIKAGEKVSLALWWKGERNPRFLGGKVEDWRQPQASKPAQAAEPPPASLDDEIPW